METRAALERALSCVGALERLLSERPAAFAPLAEPAFRMRDRLIEDLGTLEARMAQAPSAADQGAPSSARPGAGAQANPDAPFGDTVAMGGQ